jgi:hypothetical protein
MYERDKTIALVLEEYSAYLDERYAESERRAEYLRKAVDLIQSQIQWLEAEINHKFEPKLKAILSKVPSEELEKLILDTPDGKRWCELVDSYSYLPSLEDVWLNAAREEWPVWDPEFLRLCYEFKKFKRDEKVKELEGEDIPF